MDAALNVAPVAIAHPRIPGVRYWISLSDWSSVWVAVIEYLGVWPVAAMFSESTSERTTVCTSAADDWSAAE